MHLDVGLADWPARRPRPAPLPAQPLLEFLGEPLHPAMNRGVVDRDAALRHHRFEVAVADRAAAVPTDRPEDDFSPEVRSLEAAYALFPRCTPRRYFTSPLDFATEPESSPRATLKRLRAKRAPDSHPFAPLP